MLDAVQLVGFIKKTALDAVEASKPVRVCYGKVESVSPLRISVEQKLPLEEEDLVLSKNVMDIEAELDGKRAVIKNGLAAGDSVILIREQGGQKYIVAGKSG